MPNNKNNRDNRSNNIKDIVYGAVIISEFIWFM